MTSGAHVIPQRPKAPWKKLCDRRRGARRAHGGGAVPLEASDDRRGAAGGVKRVAVLPFENLGAPEDDYFADGIADEIRGKLTRVPGIVVIARGSSTPYKKTTKTPQEIARELAANYLLTATVRWDKAAGRQSGPGQPGARRGRRAPGAPQSSGSSPSTPR